MARLTTPDTLPDVRLPDAARDALEAARESVDQARQSIDAARGSLEGRSRVPTPDVDLGKVGKSIRRTVGGVMGRAAEAVPDRSPDPSAVIDRLPSRADVLAAVPGALEVARRMPSIREVRDAAADATSTASSAARDAALEAARRTPLRDHPAVRRGPGPLGIALRLGFAWLVAAAAALLIVNRDRVRTILMDARTRAARMAAERRATFGTPEAAIWSTSDAGGMTEVDETLLVETSEPPTGLGGASLTADQPAEDLDAPGWGTEGRPSSPRRLSADVAAMTTPSASRQVPDELGE
jgi:hypothetical protein